MDLGGGWEAQGGLVGLLRVFEGLRKRRAARPGPAWLRSGLASAVRRAGAPTNAQLDAEPEKAREELRLKKDT